MSSCAKNFLVLPFGLLLGTAGGACGGDNAVAMPAASAETSSGGTPMAAVDGAATTGTAGLASEASDTAAGTPSTGGSAQSAETEASGGMNAADGNDGGSSGAESTEAADESSAAEADGSSADCDRSCLSGLMTDYLEALAERAPDSLPLASTARMTENGLDVSFSEGLWSTAQGLGEYRQDFAEVPAGQVVSFLSLQDNRGVALASIRLRVQQGEITEVETIVAHDGEASFFAPAMMMADPLFDEEVANPHTREELVAITDTYFAALESSDGSMIPFASDASRNENGVITASGPGISNVSFFSYIEKVNRRYVLADTERGIVVPYVVFEIPSGGFGGERSLHLAELFKIEDGKILRIVAVMVNQPLDRTAGWD